MKIKLLVLICIFAIMFSACGAQENKSGPAGTAKSESTSATESTLNNNVISAEKKLLTVDVTIPASFFEDSTQEEIEAAAKEQGIQKVKFNDDGSVTYTMDKAKHKELLDSIKSGADETIADILNDKETYPSFVDIKYNNDLTEFTVLCDKDKYTQFEAFAALALYIQGNYYQAFNGVDSNSIRTIVKFVDKATGEVINTADSSQIGSGE